MMRRKPERPKSSGFGKTFYVMTFRLEGLADKP